MNRQEKADRIEKIYEAADAIQEEAQSDTITAVRSIKLNEKASRLIQKARKIADNDCIYPSDEDAEERLRERIADLENHQKYLVEVNNIVRFKLVNDDTKIQMLADKFDMQEEEARNILMPDDNGFTGYSKKVLHNNSAKLWNCRQQLKKVLALKAGKYKTYQINGITVEEVPAKDSFRIRFDGDPGEKIKAKLRSAGFSYSFYLKCWQTHMNPLLIDKGKRILEEIKFIKSLQP